MVPSARRHRNTPQLVALSVLLGSTAVWMRPRATAPRPPATRVDNLREVMHGVEIADPYRWLEDQQSPQTRAWIDAQNKYTRSMLSLWPGREALRQRLTQLLKIESMTLPVERGGRYFYEKRLATQEQAVLYVRRGVGGVDEALVDPNPLSPDHTTSVSLLDVSRDGTLAAYGLRHGGQDEVTIRFLDVETRRELADQLPRAHYLSASLEPDKKGFYYSRFGPEGTRIYHHVMGEDAARDEKIFGEGYGPEKIVVSDLSEDGRFLILHVLDGAAANRTEVYLQDVAAHGPIVLVVKGLDARFFASVAGERLYVFTNWEAPRNRIMVTDLAHLSPKSWRTVVPETQNTIDSFTPAGRRLVVNYLENAHAHVKVFDAEGNYLRDLELPGLGSLAGVNGRWESPEIFYGFSSFLVPLQLFRWDAKSGARSLWGEVRTPLKSEDYETRQVWYTSKDGTRVPMFLVYHQGIALDGQRPTLLTGYGGFDISETPEYRVIAAAWVEYGGVFALPNLRGGGEFGEAWHRAGMLDKKQNVFNDFLSAAEWLIRKHYTQPARLAIFGRSNGGLLVGAALTQRPDLFQAVLCGYPLLDMLRYQKFLVARFWTSEYGSAENAEQFKYLYAYSPYQHVKPGTKYPAVLFVTGDGDTRVAPLHARKMCALLQAATGSERPVLMLYDTEAGHTSALPVDKEIRQWTDQLGFLFWQLRVK